MFAAEALLDGSIQRKISTTRKGVKFRGSLLALVFCGSYNQLFCPGFDFLSERTAAAMRKKWRTNRRAWMPWNYRETLQQTAASRTSGETVRDIPLSC
jgi:hypothetical protein